MFMWLQIDEAIYEIPQLTTEEGVFIVEKYIEIKSFPTVQRHFRLTVNHESPYKKSI